jgi:alpha-beta hydrolase superfamily lysophospholipase
MTKWLRRLALTLAVVAVLGGTLCAWGEADPLAAIVDTRRATLLFGVAALLLAMPLQKRARAVLAAAGCLLVVLAASWYLRYEAIDVEFRSDVELAGTLYRPRGDDRPPVVVYVHGSGRETRREARHLAQLFARHGIATLAYDKRGAGESSGETYGVGYEGYARDAAAALRFVASRSDLDSTRIFVHGHSEGEWVVPLALVSAPPVAGVILTSGSMMTPAEQVLYETGAQLRRAGYPDEIVKRAQELQRRTLDYQRSGVASPGLDADLRSAAREPWFDTADLPEQVWPIEEYRWWRGVMDFDARPYWRRVDVPLLALTGGLDPKHDGEATQRRLRATLAEGGNEDFTGVVFPRGEHGMIEWCHGKYAPPCWPEGFTQALTSWIDGRGARQEAPLVSSESKGSELLSSARL